eukprot:gene6247-13221_t
MYLRVWRITPLWRDAEAEWDAAGCDAASRARRRDAATRLRRAVRRGAARRSVVVRHGARDGGAPKAQ